MQNNDYIKPFVAGGVAGLVTDVILFPVDTIKTRLQSSAGFTRSGGFLGIYRGLGSAVAGSMPQSALFFLVYESSKKLLKPSLNSDAITHLSATCLGETTACFARMPFEVVKQKAQAMHSKNSLTALIETFKFEGIFGFYKGLGSMLMRDLPFMMIQMPIWEYLKSKVSERTRKDITGFQSGVCGSMAGAIAGAMTCPLDVIKTRIVLGQNSTTGLFRLGIVIVKQEGLKALFSGLTPRVTLISVGGFIFLGMYDQTRSLLNQVIT